LDRSDVMSSTAPLSLSRRVRQLLARWKPHPSNASIRRDGHCDAPAVRFSARGPTAQNSYRPVVFRQGHQESSLLVRARRVQTRHHVAKTVLPEPPGPRNPVGHDQLPRRPSDSVSVKESFGAELQYLALPLAR